MLSVEAFIESSVMKIKTHVIFLRLNTEILGETVGFSNYPNTRGKKEHSGRKRPYFALILPFFTGFKGGGIKWKTK